MARHHLAGDADGPDTVVRGLVALHATDPASVYLSVLARSTATALDDIAAAMYEQRTLVRWMAMRRTLFVFARRDIPMIQAAVSTELAASLRRRLVSQLQRNGTEPPLAHAPGRWLADLEARVERALARRGTATGVELAADEPGLRTRILARTASERPHNVTTPLLTLMSAEGRLVRGTPTGAWTARQHRWEPAAGWWPGGLTPVAPDRARRDLAWRWLERFGPARTEDLRWWTGWNRSTTERALEQVPTEEVDLHGQVGIDLARDGEHAHEALTKPVAALLPALDPTPMGWKDRRWFLGIDPAQVFDLAGNIGPTVWWDGEIVGSWTTTADGDLRWTVIVDRGGEALEGIEAAAARLHAQLEGAAITPAIRTPLERSLATRGH